MTNIITKGTPLVISKDGVLNKFRYGIVTIINRDDIPILWIFKRDNEFSNIIRPYFCLGKLCSWLMFPQLMNRMSHYKTGVQ